MNIEDIHELQAIKLALKSIIFTDPVLRAAATEVAKQVKAELKK